MNQEPGNKDAMLQKILTGIAVLVLLAVAYFLFRGEFQPDPPPTIVRSQESGVDLPLPEIDAPERVDASEIPAPLPLPPRPEQPPESQAVNLPSLEQSDAFVRARLDTLGVPPAWSAADGLVRRLAVLLDSATRSEFPRRTLRIPKPDQRFAVVERDGRIYPDPRNAGRFDSYLDALEEIEPSAAARFFETIEPLVDAAFRKLGSPSSGRAALREAVAVVLEISFQPGDHELVRPKVFYEYADPDLESLPPLEKQLLRIGPRNLSRLQTYLKKLDGELR